MFQINELFLLCAPLLHLSMLGPLVIIIIIWIGNKDFFWLKHERKKTEGKKTTLNMTQKREKLVAHENTKKNERRKKQKGCVARFSDKQKNAHLKQAND